MSSEEEESLVEGGGGGEEGREEQGLERVEDSVVMVGGEEEERGRRKGRRAGSFKKKGTKARPLLSPCSYPSTTATPFTRFPSSPPTPHSYLSLSSHFRSFKSPPDRINKMSTTETYVQLLLLPSARRFLLSS